LEKYIAISIFATDKIINIKKIKKTYYGMTKLKIGYYMHFSTFSNIWQLKIL